MAYALISPRNGRVLQPAGDHLLSDGDTLWPTVDGIAYLRDKEAVRAAAVQALQDGDLKEARRHLLADQDRFSPTPPPARANIDRVTDGDDLTLRAAMDLLNYGPVGTYFAYRWCSPTFTGGLHMLERTPPQLPVIEIACGIGHFLRALERASSSARSTVGIDIVWSKLWLARRYLEVGGLLVCGDIEAGPVLRTESPHTVFCHDAFYFFEHKQKALENMRTLSHGGSVAVGHVHTRAADHAAGFAEERADYAALTGAEIHDDADYVRGWYGLPPLTDSSPPVAVGWIEGEMDDAPLDWTETNSATLRQNPLLSDGVVTWPTRDWGREYAEDSNSLNGMSLLHLAERTAPTDLRQRYRERWLVNLPDKW